MSASVCGVSISYVHTYCVDGHLYCVTLSKDYLLRQLFIECVGDFNHHSKLVNG
jgi:hypothetical protein